MTSLCEVGLPHGWPFVFVDRVLVLDPGRSARGRKLVTTNEGVIQGHFPNQPVFPGTLLIEAMAQLAGIAWLGQASGAGAYLAAISNAKFIAPVVPGDVVDIEAAVTKVLGGVAKIIVSAQVEGKEVARAEVTLART